MLILLNFVVLLAPIWPYHGGHFELSGSVSTLDYGKSARVGDARLEFQNSQGVKFVTTTNKIGEYVVSLDADYDYAIRVTAKGFCAASRPSFHANAESRLELDFTITTDCPGDRIAVGTNSLDAYFASPIPHYFEETISAGKDDRENVIVAFGKRERIGQLLKYAPLPIREHPDVLFPVTLSIGTYTIRADEIVLDERNREMRAVRNVSIADGSSSEPKLVSCAEIKLGDPPLQIRPCEQDHPK